MVARWFVARLAARPRSPGLPSRITKQGNAPLREQVLDEQQQAVVGAIGVIDQQ